MEKYYIRFRGNTRGPYSHEELLQLAERGRFAKHHEVSTDGSTWERAGLRPDLFSKQGPVDAAFDGDGWYYSVDEGQEDGPVSIRELKAMVRNGSLNGDSLVWQESMSDWEPADEVSELQQYFKQGSDDSLQSHRTEQRSDSRSDGVDPLLGMVKYCAACGKQVHPDAAMCPACGVPTDKKKEAGEISQGTIVAGYVLAFLMPLIGGIIGIYTIVKGKPGHGIGMVVLALFWFFFWLGILN